MNARLTPRDCELIQWVNQFGFVTIHHVCQKYQIASTTAYIRLKKLKDSNYLTHHRLIHGKHGVYQATKVGVEMVDDPLPPMKTLNKATYRHDLMVLSLSLALEARFNGQFLSERLLRKQRGLYGVGQAGHVSDGVLILNDKRIAIEVELSTKGKRRREHIFQQYLKQFEYEEVWYFYGSESVRRLVEPFSKSVSFVSMYPLSDYLAEDDFKMLSL